MPESGRLTSRHPKAIGISRRGSKPFAIARYSSIKETISIISVGTFNAMNPDCSITPLSAVK